MGADPIGMVPREQNAIYFFCSGNSPTRNGTKSTTVLAAGTRQGEK
jgi:hypothetical protein